MTQPGVIEAEVTSEEGGTGESVQKLDDLFVLHALVAYFRADLADMNAPASQELALTFRDVFVQYDHPSTDCATNSLV